jgi:phenylalanyl-tRNA synthetase beta chain
MICNKEEPMCIAGVLGGLESGVTNQTTSIFLESAYFNPVSIRKTAKRHALNTDASFRFERGIDPNITQYALKRAALLITDIAGGEISSGIEDLYPNKIEDFQVFLSFETTFKLIGQEIPQETIKSILTSLEIKVNSVTEGGLGLTIPSYRTDVQREADIIEEILRVYGYNNIVFSNKLNATMSHASKFEDYKVQNVIANQLISQGFNEMMANSLTKPNYTELSELLNPEHNVTMLNPLSNDLAAMRQSLLFSGLEALAYNINRKQSNLKFFEFGKTYHNYESGYIENKHLTLLITGERYTDSWNTVSKTSDFFYLKGIIESIFSRLGVSKLKSSPLKTDLLSEGMILSLGKNQLVEFGIVKRNIAKKIGVSQQVLFADFNWDNMIEIAKFNKIKFNAISKYPEVKRDFALLIDNNVNFNEIYTIAKQSEKKLLKDVTLFDVYEGDKLPSGKKSYAVSFTLEDKEKTLTDKQIDKIMNKLQSSFEKQLGAELR